jgi:hypothetical protein
MGCVNFNSSPIQIMDPLTELEAELEAERGHSILTNENKILRKKAA